MYGEKAAVLIKFWLLGPLSITDAGSRASDPRNPLIFGVSGSALERLTLATAKCEMDRKTILVTGSTGWLGGKLCEALVARGVNVVGLARRKTEIDGLGGGGRDDARASK